MEVIRNYPELDEIIGVIKRIADNLDEMTRIMQIKNPITMTPEKAKSVLNSMYGVMAARPLPDYDPEILRSEMQDLQLENDRLEKQNEIMLKFVKSAYCREMSCDDCMLYDHTKTTLYKCAYNGSDFFYDISAIAGKVLQEIDNL